MENSTLKLTEITTDLTATSDLTDQAYEDAINSLLWRITLANKKLQTATRVLNSVKAVAITSNKSTPANVEDAVRQRLDVVQDRVVNILSNKGESMDQVGQDALEAGIKAQQDAKQELRHIRQLKQSTAVTVP